MKFFNPKFLLFFLLAPFSLYSISAIWTGASGPLWNDSANWDPSFGFPDGQSDVAIFQQTGAGSVAINPGITLNQITFDSTISYSIFGSRITFQEGTDNPPSNPRIVITGGTHSIASPINIDASNLDITNNSVAPFTVSGAISGRGNLDVKSGLIVLSNANSYRETKIQPGSTVQLTTNTAFPNNQNAAVGGTLILDPGIGLVVMNNLDGASGTGIVDIDNNTLQVSSGVFTGVISGAGGSIIKTDGPLFNNTLTLSGESTYTGTTTINGGTLDLTGSITSPVIINNGTLDLGGSVTSPVTVNEAGTLVGTGIITGDTTSSGTVSPGSDSIGTLTSTGNYTQTAPGSLLIQVSDDRSSDTLNIGGTATLSGTITVNPEPGIYPAGSRFTFMNYASNVGTLTLIDNSSLDFTSIYFGTFALLVNNLDGAILPTPIQSLTGNSREVAQYLFCRGFLPSNRDLLNVMAALVKLPADQFAKDLAKLSPAQFGALPLTNLHSNRVVADVIVENTEKFYWCDPCEGKKECQQNDTSVWIAPLGYYYNQDGIEKQVGFDNYAVGAAAGANHLFFNSFHVGGGVGYTYSKIDWDSDRGDGHINSVYVGPSLGWSPKNGFINLLLLGSYNHYDIDRKIKFSNINRTATNTHHSYDILARLDGGYLFRVNTGGKLDHLFILPKASISYLNIFEERYSESGADSINLLVDSKYSAFLQPNISLKLLRDFHTQSWCIMPAFQVGWTSNIWLSSSNYKSRLYKQNVCQPHFIVKSYSRNTNQLSLGFDLNFRHTDDWIIDLGYRVDFLDDNYIMNAKIKLEKRF